MPGYEEYRKAAGSLVSVERFPGRWLDDDRYQFRTAEGEKIYDWRDGSLREAVVGLGLEESAGLEVGFFGPRAGFQARGRQRERVESGDGKVAVYREGNVYLTMGGEERRITPDGDLGRRLKYGTASWVYGEELEQRDAMGFSPDGRWLWVYRFDEGAVPDYFLTVGHGERRVRVEVEAYPKPGDPNPVVGLFVYDTQGGQLREVKVRPGVFDDGLGHYVYGIAFGADSRELFFHRMDRRQRTREFCAVDLASGSVRVVDRESVSAGWVEYGPLSDVRAGAGRRRGQSVVPGEMLILNEADGWANLYWLDVGRGERRQVTRLRSDVLRVLRVDEGRGEIWFVAGSGSEGAGDGAYRWQVYRVGFDGSGLKRLTDGRLHYSAEVNGSGTRMMVVGESSTDAPRLFAVDREGRVVKTVAAASADLGGFERVEWFPVRTLDGTATVWAKVSKPMGFDRTKRYPVLFDVYAGPLPQAWGTPVERFEASDVRASTGFLWVEVFGRGGNGRGRAFRQAISERLGIVEVDDIAAVARALGRFAWADRSRVGIHGVSYGGYAAAMALARYPELFHAASASSMVSDWRNYDTTYTERYMGLLPENLSVYEAGSVLTYVRAIRGDLMLFFGTADDNTHPANTLQLAQALTRAGRSFELQVGVDQGHAGLGFARMMEFFVERLRVGTRMGAGAMTDWSGR